MYCRKRLPTFFQVQRSPLLAARLLFCAVLNDFFQGFKALVKVQLAGIHQHSVFGLAQRGCCTVGILIVARADIGQNILVVVLFAFHQQFFIAALCAGFRGGSQEDFYRCVGQHHSADIAAIHQHIAAGGQSALGIQQKGAHSRNRRHYKSPYQLEAAVADGRAVKADTLEELVTKIYPDDTAAQQTALESIQRYNQLAKDGYDEDFHKPASRMWALENGPFYADKFTTALLLVCIGGLESDENCHTFDADRNVIPGLYVAGNVQGNRFATEYPIGLKGVSHSMAMYYGYVAGKNAMQEV